MVRTKGLLKEHGSGFSMAARLLDAGAILLAAWVGYRLRFGSELYEPAAYIACGLTGVILAALALHVSGVYRFWRGARTAELVLRAGFAWAVAFAALLVIIVLAHMGEFYSRLWLGYWFVGGLVGLLLVRVGLFGLLRLFLGRGWHQRRVVVFGAGELGQQVERIIREADWTGFRIVSFFDDDPTLEGMEIGGIPVRTDVESLPEALSRERAAEVWIALPLQAEKRVRSLLYQLRHSTVNIRMIPDLFGLRLLNYSVTDVAGMTVLNLAATPMTGFNRFLKAVEDRVLAVALLIVLAPFLGLIALLIRWQMGSPVLFSQMRCGWDGEPIRVYKFRTMIPNADTGDEVVQASPDDPRVTPLGRFLRRTSLDELPQLWNVLKGDMSIVGPRPHALEHDEIYKQEIDDYMRRHKVKPGITGWAQVNGLRGEIRDLEDMRKRVEYDLFYIENWSLWFDLRILVLTAFRVFGDPKAY